MDIKKLQKEVADFAKKRDWDKFHSPKNIAMALSGEVGELTEVFQWLTEDESYLKSQPERVQWASEELADVFIYLVRMADKIGIDIEAAVREKIKLNAEKYPVETYRGKSTKYNRDDHGKPDTTARK